ncbi:MAG: NAD(P)-binding domain-containing protein [Paenibacillus sp.]|nr:NAD(P)-binding domain-containing protein [Paenibacillus sp.]
MKVSIIGAGAMGGAIARGLLNTTYKSCPNDITVSNPSTDKLHPLARLGAITTASNVEAVTGADVVILCVKPWFVEQVIDEIKDHIDYSRTEIAVVAAGIPTKTLAVWLGKIEDEVALPPFCIEMPNTAVSLCQSMTFQVNGFGTCPASQSLFSQLGSVMVIEERQLGAATSLASCGIAYAMRYVRAAMEGGVELGIRASLAQEIVVQTLIGAAGLLAQPGSHPETEIDKVTTPGGITIKGLNAMEQSGFTSAVINGLKASTPQ